MTLASGTDIQQIGAAGSGGTRILGGHRNIISGVGATRTLVASESGSICLFDRAAGVVYTLPTPAVGMTFCFRTTVTITSNAAKVITNASTVFIQGLAMVFGGTTETIVSADFNGTSHIAISSNGTTTGGVIGDAFSLVCLSATIWSIEGYVSGSGTVATPASTT